MKQIDVMLDPGAHIPTRAYDGDGGLDLYSMEDAVIFQDGSHTFDTGVHVAIPKGYVGLLMSKSGLNVNSGITSEGVIDAGYTGSIRAKLYNHGNSIVHISKGQKITQLLIVPIETPRVNRVDKLEPTFRGNRGFGSSGAF